VDPHDDAEFWATRLSDPDEEKAAFVQLERFFGLIDQWQADGGRSLEVQPGSPFAGDDKASHPFEVSHAAQYSNLVAVDHLHSLRMLVQEAKSLHLFAPYTLTRAAIEAAATAVWLAAPRLRDERIRRRLALLTRNARDTDSVTVLVGQPSELQDQYKRIKEIAGRRPNLDPGGIVGTPPGMESIVRDGGAECAVGAYGALVAWKVCSGITHGRIWAGINLSDRQELTRVADVANVHMTARAGNVALMTGVSVAFTAEARRLFTLRASRH
jgi:hypothetical protein